MINVAFIDDGIIPAYVQGGRVSKRVDFLEPDVPSKSNTDFVNHGTICSLVFDKYLVHKTHNIIDIRVAHPNSTSNLTNFINAIQWCVQNNVDIINISLGTINQFAFSEIKQSIGEAIKNGIIIIAAMDNRGIYTLPACLYGVIGVKSSTIYKNGKFKFRWYPFDGIEIMTSGQQTIEVGEKSFTTKNQNSFSAPVITAYVADILYSYGRKSYEELLQILEEKAEHRTGKHINCYYPYFWNNTVNCESLIPWDKDLYTKAVSPYLTRRINEIAVPVVSLLGKNTMGRVKFITGLIEKLKDVYTYQIISDDILHLPNSLVVPYRTDIASFVSSVHNLFKPDMLMLNLETECKSDVYIYIDDVIYIRFEDENERSIQFSVSKMDSAVAFVYNSLL